MESGQLVGVCGIYCGACVVFRAYKDNDPALIRLLSENGLPREEIRCEGCNSGLVIARCANCVFKECVKKKGIAYCSECSSLPCEKLIDLSEERARSERKPHLILCPSNLKTLKQVGTEQWLSQQEKRWSCNVCGKKLHWYSESCPDCGTKFFNAAQEASTLKKRAH